MRNCYRKKRKPLQCYMTYQRKRFVSKWLSLTRQFCFSHVSSTVRGLKYKSIKETRKPQKNYAIGTFRILFWLSHKKCRKIIETLYSKKEIDRIGLFEITWCVVNSVMCKYLTHSGTDLHFRKVQIWTHLILSFRLPNLCQVIH